MKKHLLSIVFVAVALMTSSVADAQIRFGIKAGLNLSSLSLSSNNLDWSYKHRPGFHVGAVVDFKVPLAGLGADISVLYDQRNFRTDNGDGTYSNDKLKYISRNILSVLMRWQVCISLPVLSSHSMWIMQV